MADYPSRWEADVVLSDGGTVHIRPIRPDDAERIVALHGRFSERTRYLRYFSAYPRIPPRDLDRFVHVDHVNRVALVAQLGHDLIAVGRFDRLDDAAEPSDRGAEEGAGDRVQAGDAEVAFVVEDAHQGRGVGSALLEHLAAIGYELGVRRFVADVLPQNSHMLRVFLDAGYSTQQAYAEGVVRLTFPIAPTQRSIDVMHRREHRTEARSIERLLTPRSVAVIGASAAADGIGRVVFDNLLAGGFCGPVYPVNPNAPHVASVRAYRSVLDIPDPVDLAVVAVPGDRVFEVVEQCGRKAVRGLVVASSGFAEAGPEGVALERRVVELARGSGMRVIGPNALGVINTDPVVRLNATLAPVLPTRGRVGFFCQSGALGVAILDAARSRGLGLSTFVSAGNRADVSGNDVLQYWEGDPATEVVLLYLESFGNPRKFARLARRIARRKPVIAVKSGRGAQAPPGLSGSSANAPAVPEASVAALFESSGVIRVDALPQLFDVAQLVAHQPLPAGRRVAIVTNSPALGMLCADACATDGLEVALDGPLDVGPTAPPERFADALRRAVSSDAVDAVVAVFVPPLGRPDPAVADVLADVAAGGTKPVVSSFLAIHGVPERLRRIGADGTVQRGSVPSYSSPEAAVHALARVVAYAEWRDRPTGAPPELRDVDPGAAEVLVGRSLRAAPAGAVLGPADVGVLLAAYGISVVPSRHVAGAEAAVAAAEAIGYPVAVKSTAPALRHRIDLGGVRLDVASAEEVRVAYASLTGLPGSTPEVTVQAMVPPGVATRVEVTEDPSFGAVIGFGVAGAATDLLGDRAYRPLPLTDVDAHDLVRAPRAAPLLFGHGGLQPVDVARLEDLLLRVGRLADDRPEVAALELDPVVVRADGLSVLGAEARVAPSSGRPDTGPRRLR